jgi:hypothetical protein
MTARGIWNAISCILEGVFKELWEFWRLQNLCLWNDMYIFFEALPVYNQIESFVSILIFWSRWDEKEKILLKFCLMYKFCWDKISRWPCSATDRQLTCHFGRLPVLNLGEFYLSFIKGVWKCLQPSGPHACPLKLSNENLFREGLVASHRSCLSMIYY